MRIIKPVKVFIGTVRIHDRQLRAELAEQGHRNLDQHGGGQDWGGQFDCGQKDASGGAHDGQRCRRRHRVRTQRSGMKAAHHRGQQDAVKSGCQ